MLGGGRRGGGGGKKGKASDKIKATVGGEKTGGIVHRASCHRCGNMRKKNVFCPRCPHIFCQKCSEKMVDEHGKKVRICICKGGVNMQ